MEYKLEVFGMNCIHCEKRVENALSEIGFVSKASFENNLVIISDCSEKDLKQIKRAIKKAGYKVK